jgi:cation diffusion facilitator CzcD-associated flavoprotein CzcO
MEPRTAETEALAALEARVRFELACIDHPAAGWRPATDPVLDVLIVGAGQSGLAVAFQLLRDKVTNIGVVDRAAAGREGPWRTFARMPALRSPKSMNGPDLGVPALTYRAWHEARFGAEDWRDLDLIPKELWADYLDWFRRVLALPVENGVEVTRLVDAGGHVAATLRSAGGGERVVHARRVVLATGLDGLGRWTMPAPLAGLPADRRAHAADAIDFAALAGRRVAVVGAGASAADNAATALEAGAREVVMLCRRSELQRVQPYRWLTWTGFLRHLSDLDDRWRWRFMRHIMALRESFPQPTWDRCARHANFRLLTGAPIASARVTADGSLALATPRGVVEVDVVIAGTGVDVDPATRPELAELAPFIASWADRYTPEPGEADGRLARYPYLAADYSFTEKEPGTAPILSQIHVFNFGATMSFGPSGSSINAMTIAVPKLVAGITRGLFTADIEAHWQSLLAYDEPVVDIAERKD